ncbi:bestrophin-4-like [Ornithodoros turicata]|uniref:bestrophin-4-like n=1 Tax=Ornithodoros turicata TaxID=34597 RepID=UPI0031388286
MTVSYTGQVATSKGFGCFWRLLLRWRGSIYKLVWPDLAVYLVAYYGLSIIYRFVLDNEKKLFFEHICVYCGNFADLIPVSFVLGFYVSVVVKRWWDSFSSIPWPDSLAFFVSAFLHGQDERGRLMRRTIMRYANLSFTITLRCISPPVKKRFPTLDHIVDAGLLLGNERDIFDNLKSNHAPYWMPLVWASSIASRARKEGRIRDDFSLKTIVDELARYRSNCGGLFNYDWISIPLVYTQVTTLAVYMFFLATLFGSQGLDPNAGYKGHEIDLYFPIFNFLQFFFYMGWLKVAETLVNPFGEDDDDFEMNWVIDRNIQVSYLIVDEMHQTHPELLKDQYWDQVMPPELPYTIASRQFYCFPHEGSTACMIVPPGKASVVSRDKLLSRSHISEENDDVKNSSRGSGGGSTLLLSRSLQQKPYWPLRLFRRESTKNVGSAQSLAKPNSNGWTPTSPRCPTEDIFHLSDIDDSKSPEVKIRRKRRRKHTAKNAIKGGTTILDMDQDGPCSELDSSSEELRKLGMETSASDDASIQREGNTDTNQPSIITQVTRV